MRDIDFTILILSKFCGDNHLRKKTPINADTQTGNIHMLMKQTQPTVAPISTTLDQYVALDRFSTSCLYKS